MRNSILFDPNSRYNNIDNKNIIFLTPNQVRELDIGFDLSHFKEDEFDDLFPFLVDSLKEMVKETTIGATNGSDIKFSVYKLRHHLNHWLPTFYIQYCQYLQ